MGTGQLNLFAVCAPGLEPFTAQELRQWSAADVRETAGGVDFSGALQDVYRANLHLRTASRVLVRLGAFHAREFWELQKRAARLEWERYLTPGQPVAIRATAHKSRLYHSDAVAERVANAIAERLGRPVERHRVSADDEASTAQLIVVRLAHDACTVSVDSSGELLHRRGYRLATAKAPLRETLAAGLLMASGWSDALREGTAPPLLDPFCGSGTIAIEAALLALNLPPGNARRFTFMDWPGYEEGEWRALAAARASFEIGHLEIEASDRDAGAIEAAQANAQRAGVAHHIVFARRAVTSLTPPPSPGWIVTNPPYGLRVAENRDLRNLYAAFGRVLRERCAGWRVAFLCPEAALARQTGLIFDPARKRSFTHGGSKVTLWQAVV